MEHLTLAGDNSTEATRADTSEDAEGSTSGKGPREPQERRSPPGPGLRREAGGNSDRKPAPFLSHQGPVPRLAESKGEAVRSAEEGPGQWSPGARRDRGLSWLSALLVEITSPPPHTHTPLQTVLEQQNLLLVFSLPSTLTGQ